MTGHELRKIRESLGQTQTGFGILLAAAQGRARPFSRSYVDKMERNKRDVPWWVRLVLEEPRE